jgi:hypothetical protein
LEEWLVSSIHPTGVLFFCTFLAAIEPSHWSLFVLYAKVYQLILYIHFRLVWLIFPEIVCVDNTLYYV